MESSLSPSSIGRVPVSSPITLGVIKGLSSASGNPEALRRADPVNKDVRELVAIFQIFHSRLCCTDEGLEVSRPAKRDS